VSKSEFNSQLIFESFIVLDTVTERLDSCFLFIDCSICCEERIDDRSFERSVGLWVCGVVRHVFVDVEPGGLEPVFVLGVSTVLFDLFLVVIKTPFSFVCLELVCELFLQAFVVQVVDHLLNVGPIFVGDVFAA